MACRHGPGRFKARARAQAEADSSNRALPAGSDGAATPRPPPVKWWKRSSRWATICSTPSAPVHAAASSNRQRDAIELPADRRDGRKWCGSGRGPLQGPLVTPISVTARRILNDLAGPDARRQRVLADTSPRASTNAISTSKPRAPRLIGLATWSSLRRCGNSRERRNATPAVPFAPGPMAPIIADLEGSRNFATCSRMLP